MKCVAIVVVSILLLPSCNNDKINDDQHQFIVNIKDTQIMNNERFNIKAYQKRKAEETTEFKEDDGTLVQQFEVGKGDSINYMEYKTPPPPGLFKSLKRFYADGTLKIEGQKFHSDFNYGVWKTYDESGRLMEKKDYEAPYNLTFDEFLSIVRTYHGENDFPEVNILNNRTSITRQENEQGNVWYFSWEAVPGRIEMLKFSDATGEMLEKSHYVLEDN